MRMFLDFRIRKEIHFYCDIWWGPPSAIEQVSYVGESFGTPEQASVSVSERSKLHRSSGILQSDT
jgi:hypothetical protein